METSSLSIYSLGIVAEDKETEKDIIKVVPMEHLTDIIGDITKVKKFDKIDCKNTIEATWIPFGHSNRMSSPDVIAGETVVIFTYSDTNEYYWTTIFREPLIRRLEKVLYSYSNLPDGARVTEFERNTSYFAEVDTMNKYIHVHTSDNDGELTTYDIKINTKEGYVDIRDGRGNYIKLNSAKDKITANALAEVVIKAPEICLDGNVTISGNLGIYGRTDSLQRIATSQILSAIGGCQACVHPKPSPGAIVSPIIKPD